MSEGIPTTIPELEGFLAQQKDTAGVLSKQLTVVQTMILKAEGAIEVLTAIEEKKNAKPDAD